VQKGQIVVGHPEIHLNTVCAKPLYDLERRRLGYKPDRPVTNPNLESAAADIGMGFLARQSFAPGCESKTGGGLQAIY
jgi:hypothetical protein